MTTDEHDRAFVEGYMAGTFFAVSESLGISWSSLRRLPIVEVFRLLRQMRWRGSAAAGCERS